MVDALRALYEDAGGAFLILPGRSQYPRSIFYDNDYHLIEGAARDHSLVLANALREAGYRPGTP